MNRAEAILLEIATAVETDGFEAHGVQVRAGEQSATRFWAADVRRDVHSIAKGVCVLAAGIAEAEGCFDIDAPVLSYLDGVTPGAGVSEVTVRQLLTMRSGIDFPWTPTLLSDWPDLAVEFLSRPSRGRVFQYSNASSYTAMRALAAVVGDVHEWLVPRLFQPLGINAPEWERCPNGMSAAGGGLWLSLDELGRLGQLIRDGGRVEQRQLVPERIVAQMHSDWSVHEATPAYARYALAGWGGPGEAWRLHGAYGQLLVFLDDCVVAVAADDHAGADRMAERIVDAIVAHA